MKKFILIIAVFVAIACAAQLQTFQLGGRGTLTRAEKITGNEFKARADAIAKVEAAQKELTAVEARIAAAHKMGAESWMEWSSWYEFDGEFILYRFQNYLPHNAAQNP